VTSGGGLVVVRRRRLPQLESVAFRVGRPADPWLRLSPLMVQSVGMNLEEAARRWAEAWERGWNERDVDAIVALYADEATFSTEPFREPFAGPAGVRRYVAGAFAEEESAAARFAEPVVGEGRAAVAWWATMVENGVPITLAGTSLLRFNEEGLVVEQWDTWNQSPGRRDAPDWWR
jgi:hypothetical protein